MSLTAEEIASLEAIAFRLVLPAPSAPMEVAREFVADRFTRDSGVRLLHHWRGGWWFWRTSHWTEIEQRIVRAECYRFVEHASYLSGDETKPWAPNRKKIADVLEALAAVCELPDSTNMPSWIDGRDYSGTIVSCANGLLDVDARRLVAHDPLYFNATAVPFDFDPEALDPGRWQAFLEELWDDDAEQVRCLQEWFGYVISGRTDAQKIMLLCGPTRGGKGAIARVLTALVGPENTCGPTLSSLRHDFGLQPLLGKSVAIISDARLNGHDSSVVVERLLSISGEDMLCVNRKNRDQWNGKLPSRLMLCTNELPRLGDASAAIAGRFLTLLLERSWLGKEDPELEPALHRELTGILSWSLDGLERLGQQRRFTRPTSTDVALVTLTELASPVRAFVRDSCQVGAGYQVAVDDLWKAWRGWALDNGAVPGSKQLFGRDLRAALPALRVRQLGTERQRTYVGITLTEPV